MASGKRTKNQCCLAWTGSLLNNRTKNIIIICVSACELTRSWLSRRDFRKLPWQLTYKYLIITFREFCNSDVLSRSWVDNGDCPWKHFPYIQVSDVLCYKPIPIMCKYLFLIIILSSHLSLGLTRGLLAVGLPISILKEPPQVVTLPRTCDLMVIRHVDP